MCLGSRKAVTGSMNVLRYCTNIFDYLALATIIDDKIFCMHPKKKFKSIVTYLLLCSIRSSICSARYG